MNYEPNQSSPYRALLLEEKRSPRVGMHAFHRYYGKLIPAIPGAFIRAFTREGDTVFDPFTGSGTTAVEAVRLNRNFLGTEINPLSCAIARTKTARFSEQDLARINGCILERLDSLERAGSTTAPDSERPFVIHRDHWFREAVQRDLSLLEKTLRAYFRDNPEDETYEAFYRSVLSAIIRNVSNADNQHVFPGVSKRMRKLQQEGRHRVDTFATFRRAIQKRAPHYRIYEGTDACASIREGDVARMDLDDWQAQADLIVTNPPYISSVRYIETLKLELYWLQFIRNQDEYAALARQMMGNDRLNKRDYETLVHTEHEEIDRIIDEMADIDRKSARIIGDFFLAMEAAIRAMHGVLKPGGHAVIKISDSRIRKRTVETGRLMTHIAEQNGFTLRDVFLDEINDRSRSLTTARNHYSDIITHDQIVVWEKTHGL